MSGILLGTARSVVGLPYSIAYEFSNAECGSFLSSGCGGPFDNSRIHDGQIFKVQVTLQQAT